MEMGSKLCQYGGLRGVSHADAKGEETPSWEMNDGNLGKAEVMNSMEEVWYIEILKCISDLTVSVQTVCLTSRTGKLAHACSPNSGSQSQMYEDCSQLWGQCGSHDEFQAR